MVQNLTKFVGKSVNNYYLVNIVVVGSFSYKLGPTLHSLTSDKIYMLSFQARREYYGM